MVQTFSPRLLPIFLSFYQLIEHVLCSKFYFLLLNFFVSLSVYYFSNVLLWLFSTNFISRFYFSSIVNATISIFRQIFHVTNFSLICIMLFVLLSLVMILYYTLFTRFLLLIVFLYFSYVRAVCIIGLVTIGLAHKYLRADFLRVLL